MPELLGWLVHDQRGVAAVEFGLIATVFITMLMACVQFGLFFVSAIQLRSALAESTAVSAAYAHTSLHPEAMDPAEIRKAICKQMMLVDSCTTTLKLEQAPVAALVNGSDVQGLAFTPGVPGQLMVRRAKAQVLSITPGVAPMTIRSGSVWLRR